MILRVKKSVKLEGTQDSIWFAIGVAYMVFANRGISARITSLTDDDAARVDNSLHKSGLAVDLGARNLTEEEQSGILRELDAALDHLGYDVVLHGHGVSRHFHVEMDPKKGESWYRLVES